MNVKHIILAIFMTSICVSAHAAGLIYLENQYGAEIICKVDRSRQNPNMLPSRQDVPIGRGVRVCLGAIPLDTKLMPMWVNDIYIKASRYLPISSFVALEDILQQKIVRQFANCRQNNICNKDAVIIIKPSYIVSDWDVAVNWESSGNVIAF